MGTPVVIHQGRASVKYILAKTASRFTVQAFSTGMLSAFGHNPTIALTDYDLEIECAEGTFENAAVRVTVRTNHMEVLDDIKKEDRLKLEEEMYEKVLDVKRYPEAVFTSKEITIQKTGNDAFQAQVGGELLFHGVRHGHSFGARCLAMGTSLRISGEFPLRQSDYGIKPVSFAGGGLRLKDEVKFRIEVVAQKQE